MTIFFSTRKADVKNYQKYIKSCVTDVKIYEFENNSEYSLTQAYNKAIDMCEEDEILVLVHDDVNLEFGWDKKIRNLFEETDYGIIGVAGSTSLTRTGIWWENRNDLAGVVSHEKVVGNKTVKYDTKFSDTHNFVMNVCVVDGVFIALKKDRIKCRFNEKIDGFHFYDVSFCVDNFLAGVKIGVTTAFKIHHLSVGQITPNWHRNRILFFEHYKSKLPIQTKPVLNDLFVTQEINLEVTKIGVIILTKNKIDYLIACLKSLVEKTNNKITMQIVVGDTGSTTQSLNELNEFCKTYNFKHHSIEIVTLNFYNFAKNNNSISRQFCSDVELILCCNNDIELINNALDLMVETYQKNKSKCGTIGCRLLYPNLRVQHGGIVIYADQTTIKSVSHLGLKSFYTGMSKLERNVLGCTGAFLLISKKLFDDLKGFNEDTTECFEDVILNIETICKKNKVNYYQGDAVCYHYESLTRNESPDQSKRIRYDFMNILAPKIVYYKKTLKQFFKFI